MSLTSIHPRIIKCFACLLLLAVLTATVSSARAAAGDLLAQGAGDNGLWIAQVLTDPQRPGVSITLIRFRSKSAETWTDVASVNGRVVSMAPRGQQLAVLRENGEWMFVWPEGSAIGQPIPMQGKIRALAGDGETIWALAAVTGEMPATKPAEDLFAGRSATQPATGPTTFPTTQAISVSPPIGEPKQMPVLTTSPASTMPVENERDKANPRWMVFRLSPGGWERGEQIQGPFDAEVAGGADRGRAIFAIKPRDAQFLKGDLSFPAVDPHSTPQFSVLTGEGPPLFWIAGSADAGSISPLSPVSPNNNSTAHATALVAPKGFDAGSDRAVAVSMGRVRLFFTTKTEKNKTKILEQTYDIKTLQPVGEPSALLFVVPPADSVIQTVLSAIVMASLIFAMVVSFQNRQGVRELFERPDPPQPAPLTMRLLAGAIDLLPVFVACLVIKSVWPINSDPTQTMQDPKVNLIFWIGTAIYLIHTTLIEVIKGRSIGKMIVGLKIIGLDGQPATVSARLTRNLLRFVDLMLFGLMVFSPFRQRVGDLVAGTLVVSTKVPDESAKK